MRRSSFPSVSLCVLTLLAAACERRGGPDLEEAAADAAPPPAPPDSPPPTDPPPPPPPGFVREWVVSTGGDDGAAGDAGAPFLSVQKAVSMAGPGELIRVLPGTYAGPVRIGEEARGGTEQAPIVLRGEGRPTLVPSGEGWVVLDVQRDHWVIEGLEIDVRGEPRFAVAFSGGRGSVLRDSEVHNGAFGGGVTTFGGAADVSIEGNHIHDFFRPDQDSHGIVVQAGSTGIVIRGNVIHGNSGDSIQCLGPEGYSSDPPASRVLIEGNDLFGSVEQAVDIKTCHEVVIRGNQMHGFRNDPVRAGDAAMVIHMSARDVLVEDNDFHDAGLAIGVGGSRVGPPPSGVKIRRNRIRDMLTDGGMTGGGIRVETSEGTEIAHNTFTRLSGPALLLGHGSGGPSVGLVVRNNLLDAAWALKLGAEAPGLRMDRNLYLPGALFEVGGERREGLEPWTASGQDAASLEGDTSVDLPDWAPSGDAVDRGEALGEPYCGAAPDLGAVETGCPG